MRKTKGEASSPRGKSGVTGHADARGNGRASEGRLSRAAAAVKRIFHRRGEAASEGVEAPAPRVSREAGKGGVQKAARAARRQADIPMDVISNTYTPNRTSSKSGFRSDGADHQHDQEFAAGVADERWNDEDRFTNKSGDPRIGTHKRTYEPGEERAESRD